MRFLQFLKTGTFSLFASLMMLAAAFGASPAHAQKFDCTPKFPLQLGHTDGWLGADAAYSVPLHDGRDVWIFGDTLFGKKRSVSHGWPRMVRNSIGISTCVNGHWKIRYVIRKDASGTPQDFFTAQHPNSWYWALDGFTYKNDLWVTLLCVRNSKNAKSNALGFEFCGSDLARLSFAGANPQKWDIQYFPLVPDGTNAYPSATAVVHGKYAYIFAQQDAGTRPLLSTRIPLHGLSDPVSNLQYLAKSDQWKSGFDPQNAKHVMEQGISELSVRYHPKLKEWLAVMFAPEGFSSKILLRTAPSLTGPWSAGQVIYQVPEMQPTHSGYDKDTFCYAAKEHPEFEHDDLVFTYVCNTMAVPKIATNLNIYFPRAIRMAMPSLKH